MGTKRYVLGVATTAAGLLATGVPAFAADTANNNGVNIGNGNNVSVLPIQACGDNVAVLGAVVPVLSPTNTACDNASVTDHPRAGGSDNSSASQDRSRGGQTAGSAPVGRSTPQHLVGDKPVQQLPQAHTDSVPASSASAQARTSPAPAGAASANARSGHGGSADAGTRGDRSGWSGQLHWTGPSAELPPAPSPVAVPGHHAVTG